MSILRFSVLSLAKDPIFICQILISDSVEVEKTAFKLRNVKINRAVVL